MKKITLILGGIRSGKSYFAEQKAEFYTEKPIYLATAMSSANDTEMAARILGHQKRRGSRYETIEAPYEITGPLSRLKERTVIVDCLTLNLSNRLTSSMEYLEVDQLIETDEEYLEEIRQIIEENHLNVIFVSNEVGTAPIEMNSLGRLFQDLQGRWNRIVAEYADEVYFMRAGIPEEIKKKSIAPFRLGAPSYLLPTGFIENVTYLLGKIADIQLLAFDSLPDDPLFEEKTISTLQYLAGEDGLTYSVHMPVKPSLYDNFELRLQHATTIIEKLSRLPLSSCTFHYDLPAGKLWKELGKKEVLQMDDVYIAFFKVLRERFPRVDISLENTATPLSALDRVVSQSGISYCIDLGHLLVQDWDVEEVKKRLARTSIVHFHGWEQREGIRRDHRAVVFDRGIFQMLEDFRGIMTIENYHPLLFEKSVKTINEYF